MLGPDSDDVDVNEDDGVVADVRAARSKTSPQKKISFFIVVAMDTPSAAAALLTAQIQKKNNQLQNTAHHTSKLNFILNLKDVISNKKKTCKRDSVSQRKEKLVERKQTKQTSRYNTKIGTRGPTPYWDRRLVLAALHRLQC